MKADARHQAYHMDELLRMPDEGDAIDRLRALRAEHARQALQARHESIVFDAHASRLRRLIASARASKQTRFLQEVIAPLKTSIVTVRFPSVRAVVLEEYTDDLDWEAHLAALEAAIAADLPPKKDAA